jgi:hypothetical protein
MSCEKKWIFKKNFILEVILDIETKNQWQIVDVLNVFRKNDCLPKTYFDEIMQTIELNSHLTSSVNAEYSTNLEKVFVLESHSFEWSLKFWLFFILKVKGHLKGLYLIDK